LRLAHLEKMFARLVIADVAAKPRKRRRIFPHQSSLVKTRLSALYLWRKLDVLHGFTH
jgi:hypothetical protein